MFSAVLASAALLAPAAPALPPARTAASRCPGAATTRAGVRYRHAVLCLMNAERTRRGLPPLRASGVLARAATRHSRDMVRRDFFDHVTPGGKTVARRARSAGYPSSYVGENIAWGMGRGATPAGTVAGWMRSAGHRRVILDGRMRDLGVGAVTGAPLPGEGGGTTVTADLGRR